MKVQSCWETILSLFSFYFIAPLKVVIFFLFFKKICVPLHRKFELFCVSIHETQIINVISYTYYIC